MKLRSTSKAARNTWVCPAIFPLEREPSSPREFRPPLDPTLRQKWMRMNRECAAVPWQESWCGSAFTPDRSAAVGRPAGGFGSDEDGNQRYGAHCGKVKAVKVAPGEAVKLHQVLVEFE